MSNSIPDYLLQALELNEEIGGIPDIFDDERRVVTRFRSIEIPQRTGTTHAGHLGEMYLSPPLDEEDAVGEYVDHLDLILIDTLTIDRQNAPDWIQTNREMSDALPVGARIMWRYPRTEETEDPVLCATGNGLTPWRKYLGREIVDTRTNKKHRIGIRYNEATGEFFSATNACIGCPFAKFVSEEESHDGKKYTPACRESVEYIVWSVKHQEIFKLKGTNMGCHLALRGVTGAQKSGRLMDGSELPGIRSYFVSTGTTQVGDKLVTTYANAPQGRPTKDNLDRPVYPVRMVIGLNSYSPPTFIPIFAPMDGSMTEIKAANQRGANVLDRAVSVPKTPLTLEEYGAYLTAVNSFTRDEVRDQMMGFKFIDQQNTLMLASPSDRPMLSPVVITSDDDDAEDGDGSDNYDELYS